MGFDISFFKELQSISGSDALSERPEGYLPRVEELRSRKIVSDGFYEQTVDLVKKLYIKSKKRYQLDFAFRVHPRHIFSLSKGKTLRKQLNIAFTAGENETEFTARIGLGFSLNAYLNTKGVTEYVDFLTNVSDNPELFDTVFSKLGCYGEPTEYFNPKLTASLALLDKPDYDRSDWRFYGKLLNYHDHKDILSSTESFVEVAISVFDEIRKAGYY